MWYHAQNEQQHGPHSEADLKDLLAKEVITPQTLVWRAGMEQWLPLEKTELSKQFEVPLADGDTWESCSFSGDRVKRSEMTQLEGCWVANEHLAAAEAFVQKGGWLPRVPSAQTRVGRIDLTFLLQRTQELLTPCIVPACGLYLLVSVPLHYLFAYLQQRLSLDFIHTVQVGGALDLLLSPLWTGGILFLISQQARGRTPVFSEAFVAGCALWFRLFLTQLRACIMITVGSLLIVPGIVVAVRSRLANAVVVERRLKPLEALQQSGAVTIGYFWLTLTYMLSMGLLSMMPALFLGGMIDALVPEAAQFIVMPLANALLALPIVGLAAFQFCYYKELEALHLSSVKTLETDIATE
ncbi:MAG: hypothetical protein JWO94_297 [Verrucomicrobiaceae bacterium]|nr:hypothetical protein [Verrucomicrobiaceae bacterium]